VSITLALAACGPVRYPKSSAPNAERHASACAGHGPVKDVAVLAGPQGIVVSIRARIYRASNETNIGIAIHVPETVSLRFTSATFTVTDVTSGVRHEHRVTHAYDPLGGGTPERRRKGILEPLSGTSRTTPDRFPPRWFGRTIDSVPYSIDLRFRNLGSWPLTLRMPAVMVGAQTFEFPEIDVREVKEWIAVPLNC
jgi:hypothetical protein